MKYYENTKFEFVALSVEQARELMEAYFVVRRKRTNKTIKVSFGIFEIDFESEKKNSFFETRSLSYYFKNIESNEIIRISDHWSKSKYHSSRKLNCGYIQSCYWENYGERFNIRVPGQKYPSDLIAGKINIENYEI